MRWYNQSMLCVPLVGTIMIMMGGMQAWGVESTGIVLSFIFSDKATRSFFEKLRWNPFTLHVLRVGCHHSGSTVTSVGYPCNGDLAGVSQSS